MRPNDNTTNHTHKKQNISKALTSSPEPGQPLHAEMHSFFSLQFIRASTSDSKVHSWPTVEEFQHQRFTAMNKLGFPVNELQWTNWRHSYQDGARQWVAVLCL